MFFDLESAVQPQSRELLVKIPWQHYLAMVLGIIELQKKMHHGSIAQACVVY